jgi:hypothetical protein
VSQRLPARRFDLRCERAREARVFLRHKQGRRVPVVVRVQPLLSADGNVVGGIETHERYYDLTVTTVTCMKHPWSVRLYDPQQMRFMKVAEERKLLRQIHAGVSQTRQEKAHASLFGL